MGPLPAISMRSQDLSTTVAANVLSWIDEEAEELQVHWQYVQFFFSLLSIHHLYICLWTHFCKWMRGVIIEGAGSRMPILHRVPGWMPLGEHREESKAAAVTCDWCTDGWLSLGALSSWEVATPLLAWIASLILVTTASVCYFPFSISISITYPIFTAPFPLPFNPVNNGSRTPATWEKEERPSETWRIKGQAPTAWGQTTRSSEEGPQAGALAGCSSSGYGQCWR